MASIFHSGLSKDLSSILNDADDFNVIIQVGNGMILYNKPNITPTIFDILLKYIYTGELDLKENENNQIISSSDSFIFSFENNNDTRNMRLSHVKSHIYNIYNNNYGDFGFNFGERSLYMQDNNLYVNYDFRYGRKIKFVNTYIIEEIEAFKVVENRIDNYDMTKEMFYGIQN
ncbi:unnamed protein product [Rhizophagus irregularis]|nr:unnamed protein product [Rhizophagus irregularis]